ncbi:MAG: 16S rRNA (adenine(1518)-N(6)/adenine(1519)-N(6))-dimethyltransferase RsmA [Desulfurococcaceae archaeon]
MENRFNDGIFRTRESLYKWTRNILRKYGIKPIKKLSQNFIIDPILLNNIRSHVMKLSTLEIGCGIGTLTLALINTVNKLICIEIDQRMLSVIADNIISPNLIAVNADVRRFLPDVEQVVSNIPYHITSDILIEIARNNSIQHVVITVQKEVADRIMSSPGSKAYGKITILINVLFDVKISGIYPPSSFYPAPSVYHALLVMNRKKKYDENIRFLERLVKTLFTQRRKRIERILQKLVNIDIHELGEVGKSIIGKRVYEVDWDTYYRLANHLLQMGVEI